MEPGRPAATGLATFAATLSAIRPPVPGAALIPPPPQVVDDGLATGLTAETACRALRRAGAARVVLAAPVGSPSTVRRLRDAEGVADEVVALAAPPGFRAVGQVAVWGVS
jgi:putative phosphoribosyl transferase